jgi:hypothetical protein
LIVSLLKFTAFFFLRFAVIIEYIVGELLYATTGAPHSFPYIPRDRGNLDGPILTFTSTTHSHK